MAQILILLSSLININFKSRPKTNNDMQIRIHKSQRKFRASVTLSTFVTVGRKPTRYDDRSLMHVSCACLKHFIVQRRSCRFDVTITPDPKI